MQNFRGKKKRFSQLMREMANIYVSVSGYIKRFFIILQHPWLTHHRFLDHAQPFVFGGQHSRRTHLFRSYLPRNLWHNCTIVATSPYKSYNVNEIYRDTHYYSVIHITHRPQHAAKAQSYPSSISSDRILRGRRLSHGRFSDRNHLFFVDDVPGTHCSIKFYAFERD